MRASLYGIIAAFGLLVSSIIPATANTLSICNNTSVIVDVAIGIKVDGSFATQGWTRLFPTGCEQVLADDLNADQHFVHLRPLEIYGNVDLNGIGDASLCVRVEDFLIGAAENCDRDGQTVASFTILEPVPRGDGLQATIEEAGDKSSEAIKIAAEQRLFLLMGHDVGSVDGKAGRRTNAARQAVLEEAGSETTLSLEALITHIEKLYTAMPVTLCNETLDLVAASLGLAPLGNRENLTTQGWFVIPPRACSQPVRQLLKPGSYYVHAKAIDRVGMPIERGGAPLTWDGDTTLCTKNTEFKLLGQGACESRSLSSTGFAKHEAKAGVPPIIRFTAP